MSELDLIVTVGGKPVDDQRLGIELFKARAQTGALEQQLTKLQAKYDALVEAVRAVLIHRDLDGGDFNDAMDDLEALIDEALKERADETP